MRILACIVLAAFTLTACSRGFYPAPSDVTMPDVTLNSPVQHLISFDDATPLALYESSPVVPLFAIPDIKTNIAEMNVAFWGTKDASGTITQIIEAGVSGLPDSVHMFFDTSERPVYFRDDTNGYAIKLSYDSATQQTVTVCDPSGAAIGSSRITISAGTAQAGPAFAGGSCMLGPGTAVASAAPSPAPIGGIPTNVTNIGSLAQLITGAAYVAGFAFAIGSIIKYKRHKDNPTQVPISMPIVFLFVAAALIFLPAVFRSAGGTLFESYSSAAVDGTLPAFVAESALPGCSSTGSACPFPSPDPTP